MATAEDYKKKRTRSPAYPAIGLEDAIEKSRVLYEAEDRHLVPVEVAAGHWGYKITSSPAMQAISALKQFGLLLEEGANEQRQVKLTQAALTILLQEQRAPERIQAIKDAALAPKIHRELWDKYGGRLGSDPAIRVYLTLNREAGLFNKDVVDDFIQQFRGTIAFANLANDDKILDTGSDESPLQLPPSTQPVSVGSLVQWLSNGQYHFKEPRRVVGISDDKKWAFVEGSQTGIPMDETFVDAGHAGTAPAAPPANPFYRPESASGPSIMFPLPNGNSIEIRLAKPVSKKDFERIKKLVDLSEESLVIPGSDTDE